MVLARKRLRPRPFRELTLAGRWGHAAAEVSAETGVEIACVTIGPSRELEDVYFLRDVGLRRSQLARVVELAVAVAPAEPRRPSAAELAELLDLAFDGAPLAAGARLWA